MKNRRRIITAILVLSPFLLMGAAINKPVVNTVHTASGTVITMNLPNNYRGFVQTYFDGTNWQTYATDSPLTATQRGEIQANLAKQQQYWNKFWQSQERMFKAQQQMFDNMWSNFGF